MLTSKGGTAVAGGAFVKLAATLQSVRLLPLNGLALLFSVDRLMSTAIAVTNVIGNTVAVLAIARCENALDLTKFRGFLLAQSSGPSAQLPELASQLSGHANTRADAGATNVPETD